jgi:hypothetical protein
MKKHDKVEKGKLNWGTRTGMDLLGLTGDGDLDIRAGNMYINALEMLYKALKLLEEK